MADTFPPTVNYDKGIYVPQLPSEFVISKSALYDYYSTNSGMFPKNPGGGGGGGGGGDLSALEPRVASLEDSRNRQISAAQESEIELSSIKTSADIFEIDDIINNQTILSSAQYTLLNAINN